MNATLEAMKKIRTNKTEKYKYSDGKYWLVAGILLIVAVFVVIGGFLGYAMVRQRTYWKYVEEFSESTVYAYEHEGVVVTDGESSYLLEKDAAYVPYRLLSGLPFGRNWKKEPEEKQSMLFDFRDGSSLEIWDTPIENSSRGYTEGLLIRYCNIKGRSYQFDVEGITCEDIRKALP